MTVEFKAWPKIPRATASLSGVITEKYDGSNACIIIQDGQVVGCQSRKRLLTLEEDNYGFARWVEDNKDRLALLGDGYHYGEWCGVGIQGNPRNLEGRKFYSFEWYREDKEKHSCSDFGFVKVLHKGEITTLALDDCLYDVKLTAKREGYTPEGIIIYYSKLKYYEKLTYENPQGKWKEQA